MWHTHVVKYCLSLKRKYSCILQHAATAAKSRQSCPTLLDPRDGSPPGSPVPGILQARTLEWLAISFSNAWKWKVKVKSLSRVWLLVTPWTAAYQAPPSMGFPRREYWSGVPLPSATWVNLKNIIEKKPDSPPKVMCYMIPFIWNVQNRQIHRDSKGLVVIGRNEN